MIPKYLRKSKRPIDKNRVRKTSWLVVTIQYPTILTCILDLELDLNTDLSVSEIV